MTVAAAYARYSTERQSESSISDQFHVLQAYASSHGMTVPRRFSDEGISGAALGNRPGFKDMERFALEGNCKVILVVDLTRLSRNSGDLSKFLERMRFNSVRVIGVQDGFDSESRTARMQAGMSGIMSEEFRAMIADRTHTALSVRAEAGQATGGRAYGYRDGEADVVREIFDRFVSGDTMKAIASDLNRRSIPSPGADWKRERRTKGGRWLVSAVRSILTNERYAGRLVWNRCKWTKNPDTGIRRRTLRPESEWTIQQVQPLVDPAIWTTAQTRFTTSTGRGGVRTYLLSGLLQCGICGGQFIVAGGSQRRYKCGTFHHGGPHACSNTLSAARTVVEENILRPVIEDLLSPAAIAVALQEMRQAVREDRPGPDPQIAALERMVREGTLSAEVAAPALAEARRRSPASPPTVLPSERLWREAVTSLREVIQSDDVATAREALREIVGTIPLTPGDGFLVAELRARQIQLATGTGPGIWVGSGGAIRIHIPTRSRR